MRRLRLSLLMCLLLAFDEASYAQPTQPQNNGQDDTAVEIKYVPKHEPNPESKPEPKPEPAEPAQKLGELDTQGEIESQMTKSGSHREVTLDHGVAEEHETDGKEEGTVNVFQGEEVSASDNSDDDDKDEILEVDYLLPVGKPWKEERYTSDWLYSENYPALTAEVHWHCPFYIQLDAKEPENKRKRGEDKECVTTAQLKYWYQHEDSTNDILLDTFRITYIPTYVLQETNVLKYIKPHSIAENNIMVNVAFQYHSDITCKQFTYEIQGNNKVVKVKEEKHECKKDDSFTTSFFTTTEWVWETDEDDEDDDFNLEAEHDERDQDEEEEAHRNRDHEYDHGAQEEIAHDQHSDHKLSHREEAMQERGHGEHKHGED